MKSNLIRGGLLADKKTYIMFGVGTLSAIASYLVGDTDIFVMFQAIFTLDVIYVMHKSDNTNKVKLYGKNPRKIFKRRWNIEF